MLPFLRRFFESLPVEFVVNLIVSLIISGWILRTLQSAFPQWSWPAAVLAFVGVLGLGLFTYNQVAASFDRRRRQLRAQNPRVLEATIRDWLFRHNYAVQNAPQQNATFSLTVRDRQNRGFTIAQPADQLGFIVVGARLVISEPHMAVAERFPNSVIRSLRTEMARVGLEYEGIGKPLRAIGIVRVFPSDETLTEHMLLQQIRAVRDGLVLLGELFHGAIEQMNGG